MRRRGGPSAPTQSPSILFYLTQLSSCTPPSPLDQAPTRRDSYVPLLLVLGASGASQGPWRPPRLLLIRLRRVISHPDTKQAL